MGKINRLEKHVAELIAAGEVVERPSSVMKELVENAIDAGASSVTAEIRNGGTTYLRVTDNGSGILREDVPVAFLRHATSKVKNAEDLAAIATLGFRGEALASICAVARVELLTRTRGELAGTRYVIEGGDEVLCEDAASPEGTTLIVRDLFYNVPARMKFLKKDQTEANAVAGVLDKIALSHPEVSVRFLRDGKEQFRTPGDGKLKAAVYAVFGKEFTSGLLPVDYSLNGVEVQGLVSKPSAARPNRSMQHFFLNGRYVKSRTAMAALEEACKGSIMVGKYPSCVLHLAMACEAVDVNVHPAKLEVRFLNERPVFEAVYHGVKTALLTEDSPKMMALAPQGKAAAPAREIVPPAPEEKPRAAVPSAPLVEETRRNAVAYPVPPIAQRRPLGIDIEYDERPHGPAVLRDSGAGQAEAAQANDWLQEPAPSAPQKTPPALPIEAAETAEDGAGQERWVQAAPRTPLRIVGEVFQTYLLAERGDELVWIDKHAAHERMLYERLKRENAQAYSQVLLEPVTVTLSKEEYSAVLEASGLLRQAGFEVEDFGAGTVLLRSAPLSLDRSDLAAAVMEIAGYLLHSKTDLTTERLDWLYHNIACRAAVKAGDRTSPEEIAALVERLEQEPVRYCPHGRPVTVLLKRRELEKQFGRIP